MDYRNSLPFLALIVESHSLAVDDRQRDFVPIQDAEGRPIYAVSATGYHRPLTIPRMVFDELRRAKTIVQDGLGQHGQVIFRPTEVGHMVVSAARSLQIV